MAELELGLISAGAWRCWGCGSLGQGHGGIGVWVKQFFVQWWEENIDRFWMKLLKGLQLLSVKSTQCRQCRDSADQLTDTRLTEFKIRLSLLSLKEYIYI